MKRNFRKVPIQRLEGNFYSFVVISLLWLRLALPLSNPDNNKTIRVSKSGQMNENNHAKKIGIESVGIYRPKTAFLKVKGRPA
jgi:hypothetical protein